MFKAKPALAVLTGGLILSGCQTTEGKLHALNAGIRVPPGAQGAAPAEDQLKAGRTALQQHNYAQAIAELREASVEPTLAPAAFNGLGVAYAGIGRNDLAEQYFRRAISLDRSNIRYEENLARLYRVQLAAAQVRRDKAEARERMLAERGQAETKRWAAKGVSVMTPIQRMVRSTTGAAVILSAPSDAPDNSAQPRRAEAVAVSAPGRLPAAPVTQVAVITAPGLRPNRAIPVVEFADASLQAPPLPDVPAVAVRPVVFAVQSVAVSAPGLRPGAAVAVLELARAPISIADRHIPSISQKDRTPAPDVGGIISTGRVYAHAEQSSATTAIGAPQDRAGVQLASNNTIGSAVLGPIAARKPILGIGSDTVSFPLALADLP